MILSLRATLDTSWNLLHYKTYITILHNEQRLVKIYFLQKEIQVFFVIKKK